MMLIKRMLCLILAGVMMLALAACTDNGGSETPASAPASASADPETQPPTEEPTLPAAAKGIDLAAYIRGFDTGAAITEQIVYESDNIRVTAVSLSYDPITGAVVLIRAQNDSDMNLMIQVDTCAVNGYMMPAEFSLASAAGKTAEGEMTIPYASLALAGVEAIATLEFTLMMVDPGSFEVLGTCGTAVMQTTAVAEGDIYEPVYDEAGQTVFDGAGVRIVLKGIDRARQISEYSALVVYIYNGSDRSVSIQAGSLLVNGYEMTATMTTTVMPGKGAVDLVEFFDMDLDEYGIDEVETTELRFRIVDEETWKVIAETETVMAEEDPAWSTDPAGSTDPA